MIIDKVCSLLKTLSLDYYFSLCFFVYLIKYLQHFQMVNEGYSIEDDFSSPKKKKMVKGLLRFTNIICQLAGI